MFSGSIVALVTPFTKGRVDLAAVDRLVDFHLAAGTDGIAPCGTTGEASTLSDDEYGKTVGRVVSRVKGRVPVIAGAGSNSTAHAEILAKLAHRAGADALLVVTPYYNKPNFPGILEHYKTVARVGLPVILYNVPSRTGVSLTAPQVERLFGIRNVAAIKEASGSVDLASDILHRCKIPLLSGTDSINVPLVAMGAVGAISVVANVAPRQVKQSIQAALAGDRETAIRLHNKLLPLSKALFLEGNPIPLKEAMRMIGLGNGEMRLPLERLSKEHIPVVRSALIAAGLLSRRQSNA